MSIIPPRNFQPSTLNRFGVSSSSTGETGGILMPKLKHRFRVQLNYFGSIGITSVDFTKQVVTAGRPQIQHNSTPLHSYNNIAYYANKPEWQAIELTLRDDITNSVSSLVSAQLQRQMNHFTQSAAAAHQNYKFELLMQTLNGSMSYPTNVIEEWKVEGCFLEQVQYDQMDYASSDPVMITLTIRYDNATQGNEAFIPLSVSGA
jgi:hypothetical protein